MEEITTNDHNCTTTIAMVVSSLDGYLSESEEKAFLEQVNCCGHCLEKYKIEKSFKKFLLMKISTKTADQTLIQKIKERIQSIQ